ncbi:MAG: tetratricopeptide repeat protein [Chitinispirillaceae bacterium]|nr:tetratricopeptide repeat protein [Chitinispirillaceae bacterium]
MRPRTSTPRYVMAVLLCGFIMSFAEKELRYDPEKGIIFVEKQSGAPTTPSTPEEHERTPSKESIQRPAQTTRKGGSDIHVGRKKDPPELYFKSGLEYYKNNDFTNALKNFSFADSVDHRPEYRLWMGKTLRSLGRIDDMLKTMIDIIKNKPGCEVADDALFELALHYKLTDDYDKATELFSQLIEQYPFGQAYSTGEELREIAREQRRLMRAEMINLLTILGFIGEDLPTGYRNFQKVNKLPITEVGDQQTVRAIKEQHRRHVEKEEMKSTQKARLDRYQVWILGAIAAGALNTLLLLLLLSKIQARKRHLVELERIVIDLDAKKL